MSYQVKIGKNNEILLPEGLCNELEIEVGDILICEVVVSSPAISMKKHSNQSLTDDEITAAGNLTRVFSCDPEQDAIID